MKVLHIITCLDQGGAEAVLCRLVAAKEEGIEYAVVSLKGRGFYGETLESLGLVPHYFQFARFFQLSSFFEFVRLVKLISKLSPDVVQTWLYHADLIGGVAARLAGCRNVVWGIRTASLSPELISRFTLIVAWLCARLSKLIPAAITTCSEEAARTHKAMGYNAAKFHVIPNGYDLTLYAPDSKKRHQIRREFGIREDDVLMGCVARWNPYKDHPNLLRALTLVASGGRPVRCILVGAGMSTDNVELVSLLSTYNLAGSVILAGPRGDVPSIMNSLDLHILPSISEAFPNVVAEAMACGVPCLVTDVGDAALIVGNTGWVVPPNNAPLLARAIENAVLVFGSEEFVTLRLAARERILHNFSLATMKRRYWDLWHSLPFH